MRRDEALALLRNHREELRGFGIKSLGIFGSVARDEAGPDSDVDLLVEFAIPAGLFELIRLQRYLETLFRRRVDLATPKGLRHQFRGRILRDTVYAA
jgi:predicted nucleotidyltransferase